MKTLNLIYISRIGFGIIAALVAALVVDLKFGTPLINGISVALAVYLLTYYLIKWQYGNKIDRPTKLFTMGIGIYFITFIMVWVLAITPFLAAPVASFTIDAENPVIGQAIKFNAVYSEDSDGEIVDWTWNFGDSSTGTGETFTHTYDLAGHYIVMLTVKDDHGITSFTTMNLTIVSPS